MSNQPTQGKRIQEIRERLQNATQHPFEITSAQLRSHTPHVFRNGEHATLIRVIAQFPKSDNRRNDMLFFYNARSDIDFLLSQLEAKERKIQQLKEYAQHESECPQLFENIINWKSNDDPCTCGLSEILGGNE